LSAIFILKIFPCGATTMMVIKDIHKPRMAAKKQQKNIIPCSIFVINLHFQVPV